MPAHALTIGIDDNLEARPLEQDLHLPAGPLFRNDDISPAPILGMCSGIGPWRLIGKKDFLPATLFRFVVNDNGWGG